LREHTVLPLRLRRDARITDEQRDVLETVRGGASSIEEVSTALGRRKSDIGNLVDLLVRRGVLAKRPLREVRP